METQMQGNREKKVIFLEEFADKGCHFIKYLRNKCNIFSKSIGLPR
jgi:hypothetical protein